MKEYIEEGTNLQNIKYFGKGEEVYQNGRQVLVRACHDVLIKYKEGILLITRDNEPAKGYLWAIGGGIRRGVSTEKSLAELVKGECGLEISNLKLLDWARMIWNTTPNQNIKQKNLPEGIDDLAALYYCESKGNLKLDKLHKDPIIVTKEKYSDIRDSLHDYIKSGMDKAIKFL